MVVQVCVGSSCHLKGSYEIVELMKKAIEENKLDCTLKAAFCLGKCTNGVSIKVDDEIIVGVNKENFDDIFRQYILKR